MARVTITIPDRLHANIVTLAENNDSSFSGEASKLIELGLIATKKKVMKKNEKSSRPIDEYCHQLIIQLNGIIKELAVNHFHLTQDKISTITNETMKKYESMMKENK